MNKSPSNGTTQKDRAEGALRVGSARSRERHLEYLALDELAPDPRNPRKHSLEQIRAIARSIESFGFAAPILIDKRKRIIAGHGRYEAAKLVGHTHVPTIRLDELTETQARAYMLADNQLSLRSSWNDNVLALHLRELSELSLDFDIEATGFEPPEIDLRIQTLEDVEATDKADTFEAVTSPAVSRPGDLWLLDEHRLLCGSALDASVYASLLDGQKAAAVFADPPFNVRINGHVGGKGAIKHREFAMASGEMSELAFTAFLRTACEAISTHAARGAIIFVCMDWRHIGEITSAARAADFDLLNLCVWAKSNGGMGSLYRSRHELVFVFRNGPEKHRNNVELGRHGRNRTNVWNYPGANSFARSGRVHGSQHHPTPKPIALVAGAILDVTKRKDIVLDPFLGSGTTILAAERTGRRGYGIELDPIYVDTAITRWEAMTGRRARHASGVSFGDLRGQRSATP